MLIKIIFDYFVSYEQFKLLKSMVKEFNERTLNCNCTWHIKQIVLKKCNCYKKLYCQCHLIKNYGNEIIGSKCIFCSCHYKVNNINEGECPKCWRPSLKLFGIRLITDPLLLLGVCLIIIISMPFLLQKLCRRVRRLCC